MMSYVEELREEEQQAALERVLGMVSVVMPAYNCEELLAESIRSVIAQTYNNWELLVVDDASSDKTQSVARKLATEEQRIRVIALSENGGVANARNVAMRAARGQYLAFLDSDDLWLPGKLSAQIEFMSRHQIGFSFSRYRRLKSDGSLEGIVRIPDRVAYNDLLKGNVIGCLTVMLDRNKIPPFTMRAIGHEDYLAWLHILKGGHVAWGLQKDLARYRVSPESVSGNKQRSALWTWRIYREIENLPLTKSLWCFVNYSVRSLYRRLVYSKAT